MFRSCDLKQKSCQKSNRENDFQLLLLHMQWSWLISYFGHFPPEFQVLYEEIKCQKMIFERKQLNFCNLNRLELKDHQSRVFKIDMQPTAYQLLVSHKFSISVQKLKSYVRKINLFQRSFQWNQPDFGSSISWVMGADPSCCSMMHES